MGRVHPNLFAFIELARNEQQDVERQLTLLRAGNEPPLQKRKYRVCTQKLQTLKRRLEAGEIVAYQYAGAVHGILSMCH